MKQDEAETMARFALERGLKSFSDEDVLSLCRYIVGSMKREIENAAYERAAGCADDEGTDAQNAIDRETYATHDIPIGQRGASRRIAAAIRALIQPPAQKEDGE